MAKAIQFSIRHLMVLTVVVAVVAAILGPIVRGWNTERQTFFAVHVTVSLLALAGSTCLACLLQMHIERVSGEIILRTRPPGGLLVRALLAAGGALLVAKMVWGWVLLSSVAGSGVDDGMIWLGVFASAFVYAVIIPLLLALFLSEADFRSIDFCERGLTFGPLSFLPYSKIRHYRWSPHCAAKLILARRFMTSKAKIPPDMRCEVIRLLDQHGVPRR